MYYLLSTEKNMFWCFRIYFCYEIFITDVVCIFMNEILRFLYQKENFKLIKIDWNLLFSELKPKTWFHV